jgi:hypothetical protein
MKTIRPIWLALGIGLCSAASAAQVITEPFLGVRHIHQTETSPRPLSIHVVEIDLGAPGVSFQVTPAGPEPRPIGSNPGWAGLPMETIRQTTRQFANSVGAQVAINASFFSAETIDGQLWSQNLGLTASNGHAYSPWETGAHNDNDFDDALNITQSNQAAFVKMPSSVPTGFETTPIVPLYNTVTGSHRIIQSGVIRTITGGAGNPFGLTARTAVGLTAGNAKLLFMTVDTGSGVSQGVTVPELAALMASHGATNAINLDGGGSTTMVMDLYGDGATAQLVNVPSGSERMVGVNFGVFALPNGDFNVDGAIDAADYVVWRKTIGGSLAYDAWRKQFGSFAGGGGQLVPEPTITPVALVLVLCLALQRNVLTTDYTDIHGYSRVTTRFRYFPRLSTREVAFEPLPSAKSV